MSENTEYKAALDKLQQQMDLVIKNQERIDEELKMIFADISHFENMVLKVLDNALIPKSIEKTSYQH